MIDLMEQTKETAREPNPATLASEAAAETDAHETLDSSLSAIIGNARMIALDAGVPGRELAQRLAAIIDSAHKISLIVHRQYAHEYPGDGHDSAGQSQSGGDNMTGQERVHAGHRVS